MAAARADCDRRWGGASLCDELRLRAGEHFIAGFDDNSAWTYRAAVL